MRVILIYLTYQSADTQWKKSPTSHICMGSVLSTIGRCQSDIFRRIGTASSAMYSMNRVWRQTRLQLQTKLRLYQTCILPILLHSSDPAPSSVCSIAAGQCCGSCSPASHPAVLSARQVERPRRHIDTRRQDRQCV